MEFIQFLDWKRNISNGLIQQEILTENLPEEGIYVARIFAKKAGKEDWIDTFVQIGSTLDKGGSTTVTHLGINKCI